MKCVMLRVLCQNACFSESPRSLACTHTDAARTRRGRFGCTKSEAALWVSDPTRWGEKSQSSACLVPLALTRGSPSTLCAGDSPADPTWAGCSLVAAAAGGQTRTQAGRAGWQGVQSGDQPRPPEVVLQNGGQEDGWGSVGGPHIGGALRTVRQCPLKSRSESPSTLPAACTPDVRLATSPRPGSQRPPKSRQVLQRLIQMT